MFNKKVLAVLVLSFLLIFASISFAEVKIQFWHAMSGNRIQIIKNMAEEFMKLNPDIKVETQYTGSYRDTLNKFIAAVKAGNPPHIVQIYDIGTQLMKDSGVIVPIGDLIAKDPFIDSGVFMDQVTNYYRVGGKLYSMPFNSSNPVLYYNKTMFKEAGLDPNDPPRTFEDILAIAGKFLKKDANGNIIQTAITWPMHTWFFEQFMANQNAPLVDKGNGRLDRPTKAIFNSPAGLKIFKFWKELTDKGYILNTKKEDWDAANQYFVSKKVAMLITSTSDITFMVDQAKKQGFELGTFFLPRPKDAETGGVVIGGASLWMSKDHPKKEIDAAWKFMKFMASEGPQITWHKSTGYFPIRKDAVLTLMADGYYKTHPDHLTALLQLLMSKQTFATNGAIMGPFPKVRDIIESAVENMLAGKMTPEEALAWAEKESTKAIQEYNELYK